MIVSLPCTKTDQRLLMVKCYRLNRHYVVYRFWSPLLKRFFYVGKGGHKRPWSVTRNGRFLAHMALLARKKLSPIVEITHWCKTDEEARYKESQHILYLNAKGHPLANGQRLSCRRAREDGKWRRLRGAHLKPRKKRRRKRPTVAPIRGVLTNPLIACEGFAELSS